MFITSLGEFQGDFCENLTEFYQISLKVLVYLTDFKSHRIFEFTRFYSTKDNRSTPLVNLSTQDLLNHIQTYNLDDEFCINDTEHKLSLYCTKF